MCPTVRSGSWATLAPPSWSHQCRLRKANPRHHLCSNRAEEDAVPLMDLSMVEQRYAAVREVLDRATLKDLGRAPHSHPSR
jgi:hypothetical protein